MTTTAARPTPPAGTTPPAGASPTTTGAPGSAAAAAGTGTPEASAEFERQVQALVDAGYPALAGLDEPAFRSLLRPLRSAALSARPSADGRIAFAVVVTSALVSAERALPAIHWRTARGKTLTGWTEFTADELATFTPVAGVEVPDALAYLVTDVDTGSATLGVTAREALGTILAEGRTPLTIDEGVSLLALFPGILKERNAFFLPGSRCGDKRVTALWVSKGHPRLGWCWEGNPHTWLGSASAGARPVP
jgi:uncharacterized protein DUF5701